MLTAALVLGLCACGTNERDLADGRTGDGAGGSGGDSGALVDSAGVGTSDAVADLPVGDAADGALADTSHCECPVGQRRCDGQGALRVCGADCRWETSTCADDRCLDGACCECSAGPSTCTLDDTALRSCSNGCTWDVELCLAGCRNGVCCEACAADMRRCQSPSVLETCVDGCVAQQACTAAICAEHFPHAPLPICKVWTYNRESTSGCGCQVCQTAEHCEGNHTLGVICGNMDGDPACRCRNNADCLAKTAGPTCLRGLCGCAHNDDCPGRETCVVTHVYSPLPGHRVCSGNLLWPAARDPS